MLLLGKNKGFLGLLKCRYQLPDFKVTPRSNLWFVRTILPYGVVERVAWLCIPREGMSFVEWRRYDACEAIRQYAEGRKRLGLGSHLEIRHELNKFRLRDFRALGLEWTGSIEKVEVFKRGEIPRFQKWYQLPHMNLESSTSISKRLNVT